MMHLAVSGKSYYRFSGLTLAINDGNISLSTALTHCRSFGGFAGGGVGSNEVGCGNRGTHPFTTNMSWSDNTEKYNLPGELLRQDQK